MKILQYITILLAAYLRGLGNNQIIHIRIRKEDGMWKFDDPARGLIGEPFVAGIPEILEDWLSQDGRLEAALANGFGITASSSRFPGASHRLDRLRFEMAGTWYADGDSGKEGWLCPALLKYFFPPPSCLWVKLDV